MLVAHSNIANVSILHRPASGTKPAVLIYRMLKMHHIVNVLVCYVYPV
jgi:hypothetical protein